MIRLLTVPVLIGCAVLLLGLGSSLRSLWKPLPQKYTVQLEAPTVRLKSEEVQLVVYLDPGNLELSQPKYKTIELPADKPGRLLRILSALRDNLEGLWPEALPLPIIFLYDQTVVVHFQFENAIPLAVAEEQRLYQSILATLKENGASKVAILVNDQSETFLGHIALDNQLE
jgi:hypothetical protein